MLKIPEVGQVTWFIFSQAKEAIRSNSLAEEFLPSYLAER